MNACKAEWYNYYLNRKVPWPSPSSVMCLLCVMSPMANGVGTFQLHYIKVTLLYIYMSLLSPIGKYYQWLESKSSIIQFILHSNYVFLAESL